MSTVIFLLLLIPIIVYFVIGYLALLDLNRVIKYTTKYEKYSREQIIRLRLFLLFLWPLRYISEAVKTIWKEIIKE